MNNFELNKAITEILHPAEWEYWRKVDYCNNWNDLMPLVVEHGINIMIHRNGDASAYQYVYDGDEDTPSTQSINKNLQRALAECLYLVLLAKSKEQDDELSK